MRGEVTRIEHPALVTRPGAAELASAELSDRERLQVLFQAAALLAHLERAGWRLRGGWEEARVDGEGLLRNVAAEPGRPRMPAETRLRRVTELLFGEDTVAGRGEARRALRQLVARWRDGFLPTAASRLPEQILSTASFLLDERAATSRTALLAEVERDGENEVWLALGSPARRRLRREAREPEDLRVLLAGPRFAECWAGGEGDPDELAARGRWRDAVRAWEAGGPTSADDRMAYAEVLYACGRFESARAAVKGLRRPRARCLALGCAYFLSELEAARRMVRDLESAALPPGDLLTAAQLAIRLLGSRAEPEAARAWRDRALAGVPEDLRWRAELVAAEEAWDRGALEEVDEHLAAARDLLEDPDRSWRWHQVAALACLARQDAEGVVRHTGLALAADRRSLRVFEAAALWNDHAVGRIHLGDLAGGEKACAHAARLLRDTEGPRRDTLALRNLAEIRLRRGRVRGVEGILDRSFERNQRDENLRAMAEDAALRARFELVQGRPLAAVEIARSMRERLEVRGSSWHREELSVMEARALGWLGRTDDARESLEDVASEAWRDQLEPEERPALWALAGERERALEVARDLPAPARRLWDGLLVGEEIDEEEWRVLEGLESYRAARWVWDAELTAPGRVPVVWLRRGVETLRRVGAGPLAERLTARFDGPWEAIGSFLALEEPDGEAAARLFAATGHGEARLCLSAEDLTAVLVDGPGGDVRLAAPREDGVLELWVDGGRASARVLLEIVARCLPRRKLVGDGESRASIHPGIVGRSAALEAALEPLAAFARGTMPILVLGESGTGKELVARQVHRLSRRADRDLVTFDCTTMSESLGLSQLFGHVRGAFTGADRDRMGLFETARGGTVFLDEIGELPLAAQAMLLRVLQEGEIVRVGETLPRKVDVRVVAATHRDLRTRVEEGAFREDLYFRLAVAEIELPPLRERTGDVALLAGHFLRRLAPEYGERRLTAPARELLESHDWPGNVRELQSAVHRAAALAIDGEIRPEHFRIERSDDEPVGDYHRQVEDFRRRLVEDALAATDGNRSEAARRLGITRQALSYLVKSLGIKDRS